MVQEAPRSATKRFRDRSPDDAWSSAYKRSREKSLDTLWSSSNGADRLQLQFDAAVPDSHGAQLKRLAVEQHDAEDFLVPEADGEASMLLIWIFLEQCGCIRGTLVQV